MSLVSYRTALPRVRKTVRIVSSRFSYNNNKQIRSQISAPKCLFLKVTCRGIHFSASPSLPRHQLAHTLPMFFSCRVSHNRVLRFTNPGARFLVGSLAEALDQRICFAFGSLSSGPPLSPKSKNAHRDGIDPTAS